LRLLGRILARLIIAAIGYVAASFTAGLTIVVAVAGWASAMLGESYAPGLVHLVYAGGALGAFVIALAFAPGVLIALVAELFSIRNAFYYIGAGGLTGALGYAGFTGYGLGMQEMEGAASELLVFAAAGLVAGAVYWAVAGRSAGVWPAPAEAP
jgi:hypothetical protein